MILVAGSANLDFVVRAGHIPAPGETVLGRDFQTFPGGKGANQAVACARAGGAATAMLCALGDDDFAKPLLASLADARVQLHPVRSSQPTGTAFICVSDEGENAITVAPGANEDLKPSHWPEHLHISHLLMQLETPVPTVLAFAQAARKQGAKVVLNAAPARELPAELLGCIDILVVNEGELATLAGKEGDVLAQLQRLAKQYHLHDVIVTLGAQGCLALHQGHVVQQKAYKIDVVDTTAAGDTFCGALVAALTRGAAMQQCLAEASAASALACTKLGAQSSIPFREEVMAFMKNAS
ncbi:MAG: ribokinase [Burkholderiales bacterium]|nr:MAG: ribokinase [Burkholderiales bacterium]